MKRLALLAFIGLTIVAILACGGETAEPTDATVPTAAPTQPPAGPTDAPAPTGDPEPTAAPTDAPEPTTTPEPPTAEPESTAEPTAEPEPTATPQPEPEPTPTSAPEPEPTPMPTTAPTATPEPTAAPTATPMPTPEPEPTAARELPIAADLAPLGNNLQFVAYLDSATQTWKIYDTTGDFKPEDIPLPPGTAVPPASDIGALTELQPGEVYTFVLNEDQTVELDGNSYTIRAGGVYVVWK